MTPLTDNLDPLNPDANDDATFDSTKDYLKELVGEGKKFKTVEDLAKGKAESDAFISSVTRENKELRDSYKKAIEEVNSRTRLEDLVTKLSTMAADTSKDDSEERPNDTKNESVINPDDV